MNSLHFGPIAKRYRDSHTAEELWAGGDPTLSDDCRYNGHAECWIFAKGEKVPKYLQIEKRQGRVLQIGRPHPKESESATT